jgi:hypothetical protein
VLAELQREIGLAHQIGLADEQPIRKPHLAAGFAARVQMAHRMLRVDEGQDRVRRSSSAFCTND